MGLDAVHPLIHIIPEGLGNGGAILCGLGSGGSLGGGLGGLSVLGILCGGLRGFFGGLGQLLFGVLGILILGGLIVLLHGVAVHIVISVALGGPCAVGRMNDSVHALTEDTG
ncbi:hypothetical protein SDC9_106015 [bioreactor metagenome]|uniref:Uncharacterized protein n=1 Tax=bioreactor metagenome TaxID=1076179 RepID=A0A645B287_9ZZZZ